MMIKLRQLEKFYNRNKQNEIHVINKISLDLPESGLVVLLGPSGSGKTTLLNVLGGLDKVQSGSIQYGDKTIERYSSHVWDDIRNRDVGYIFQNYNLLTHLTVYENISLTLNMIGIYDKDEIDRRIDYILDHMGMINYRKRRASQLSGGQQQRVAIARALAKNPKVIIADEPTGNLDSKNTQDIMDIIKAISRTKLVVLVTHEDELADYYADRIIRLSDGQIVSDETNRSSGSLDLRHDTDIYLHDMRTVVQEPLFELYSDEELDDDVKVRLIVKNKTLYVDVNSTQYQKIQLVQDDSELQIHDSAYEAPTREKQVISEFDLDDIIQNNPEDHTKHSVISVKDSLRIAWGRMTNSNIMGKVFYVAFALIAGLIALAIGMGNSFVTIDPESYLSDSKDLILVDKGLYDYDDFLALEAEPSIAYLRLHDNINFDMKLPTVFQSWTNEGQLSGTAERIELLNPSELIEGRNAQTPYEFVIDKVVAEALFSNSSYRYLGITSYQDLMELEYSFTIPGALGDYVFDMTLVGVVESQTPMVYMDQDMIYMLTYGVGLVEFFEDDITIVEGALPSDELEMLIIDNDFLLDPISNNQWNKYNETFLASGSFTMSGSNAPIYLVQRADIKEAYFNQRVTIATDTVNLIATDRGAAVSTLESDNFVAQSYFAIQRQSYSQARITQGIATITFIIVVLAASAASYFFVIRSSLLSRIYEVSVYRALGVNRLDIQKMFAVETLLVTTITSIIGYTLATILLWRLQLLVEDFTTIIKVTPLSIIVGLLLVYTINLFSGLFPVANLLRKTPAEILSKYDF